MPSVVVPAVRWAAIAQAARQLGQIASGVVLARLLTPEDFGLIAMAIVVTGLVAVLRDLGIGASIVQTKDLTEDFT